MKRDYGVIIFGATGFTGALVARYFAEKVPLDQTNWTIAGRSLEKLEILKEELEAINPACTSLKPLCAEVSDTRSLNEMASAGKVILTTVGPYARYGDALVKACVEQGTHYVDITGEPSFWYASIERYHALAADKGAIIVPCCGFESIPPDMGVLFALSKLPKDEPKSFRAYMMARGEVSGGTWHSAINGMATLSEFKKSQGAKAEKSKKRATSPKTRTWEKLPGIHRNQRLGKWALPMPTIDPAVVRRSARIRGDYGPDFQYGYYMATRNGAQAAGIVSGVGALFTLAQLPPTRKWLLSLKPPGTGPSDESMEKGWFRLLTYGRTPTQEIVSEVSGGEPGYSETAKMLAESALCLAEDSGKIPGKGGVLTPASAFGTVLIERLLKAGIQIRELPTEGLAK